MTDDRIKLCLKAHDSGFRCSLDRGHSTPVHIALYNHTGSMAEIWPSEGFDEGYRDRESHTQQMSRPTKGTP